MFTEISIPVVYEDEYLLALDKPSGLLVHRGWGKDRFVLVDWVRDYLRTQTAYPIHRIDRQTSGVVLFAKNGGVAKAVRDIFDGGRVEKEYLALVRGTPPDRGVIDHAIPRNEGGNRVSAVTFFRTLVSAELQPRTLSLVEAAPKTGRLHQVRRHLKHISHPVIGDANYGKGPLNRAVRERYGLGRLALHACSLTMIHPMSQEKLIFRAEVPSDLADPLSRMGFNVPVSLNNNHF